MLLEPGEVVSEELVGGLLTVNRDLFSCVSLVVTCKIDVDYIYIYISFHPDDNFCKHQKISFAKKKREFY